MAGVKLHYSIETGKYKCNYCGHDLAAGTSTTRLRAHLTREPNAGSRSCPNVPDDVRISLLLCGKKTATGPSSSNLPPEGMSEATASDTPPGETEATAENPPPVGMTEGMTVATEGTNESSANNDSGSEGQLQFLPQQHTMSLPYVADLLLGETTEAQETHLRDDQIDDMILELDIGATDHYIPPFSPELNNELSNQGGGVLQYTMPTHPNESVSVENLQHGVGGSEMVQQGEMVEGNQGGGLLQYTMPTHLNESGSVENLQHGVGGSEMVQHGEMVGGNQGGGQLQYTMPTHLNESGGVENLQHGVEGSEVGGNQEGEGSAFRTKMLVGESFMKNEEKIWSQLMDDEVLRVGIYGMGGVGKTTLMRHIQTRLKGQSPFKVYWVTVSQDFSIRKLQNLIAQKINLNFSDKEDEEERTEKLTQALQEKQKCVLILDDLWNYFDVDEVGIPVKAGGCKLVLTTRLLNVCQTMDCNEENIIQVRALSKEEAWILFTKELGNYSTEVEQLAKFVAIECDGLPLGIRVMARAMKGIREVHSWRNALEELRESKLTEGHKMREEVLSVLKFSYLHLIDPALRKCLLYCALFPEDHKIYRDELIEYMIVEGIIDAKKSRRAELDRGHTMLDTLVNACLLEGNTRSVWMHDLIRDMLIYELRERSNTLVEAGAQLKELPDLEEWTENLVCVSLMYNDIQVIPFRHTPRCPDLSTLLLRDNCGLRKIAGSFLKQFQKLKVLDLFRCFRIEELPAEVSDLVYLTALLLRECSSLSHVPSLAKLERLKKLDLFQCKMLERMPEGVEFLINLKHLDLSLSGIRRVGSEIISKLSRLQVLILFSIWETGVAVSVKGKEVGMLEKLESLYCGFDVPKAWREYMKSREKSQQSLTQYFFRIGEADDDSITSGWNSSCGVYLLGDQSNDYEALPLPTGIQTLIIRNDLNGSLWGSVLAVKHTTQLHFLRLDRCDGPWDNLCGLSGVETSTIATTPFLSNLQSVEISQCHKLKNLYPARLLPNLKSMRVSDCSSMEELFGTDQEGEQGVLNLPKLNTLALENLRELRSIYKGIIICHSLSLICLVDCPKLERITLPLPQPLLRLQVWPREWWESVQWGSANDKIHLESFGGFCHSRYLPGPN